MREDRPGVRAQLPLLRPAAALPGGLAGPDPGARPADLPGATGNDANPAVEGFDPDVSAELYTTNGEFTDWAHGERGHARLDARARGGLRGLRLRLPRRRGGWSSASSRSTCRSRIDLARSAGNPAKPKSHLGNTTEPFYLELVSVDPSFANNPLADFRFTRVLRRPAAGRGAGAQLAAQGAAQVQDQRRRRRRSVDGPALGGRRELRRRLRHLLRGTPRRRSPAPTRATRSRSGSRARRRRTRAARGQGQEEGQEVRPRPQRLVHLRRGLGVRRRALVRRRRGLHRDQPGRRHGGPNYLDYYTDALTANGISHDVYDVDAKGRRAPDALGVLGHYDASSGTRATT